MLQTLENAYLAILRAVVIVASGIMLVGVVMFSASALKGFGAAPETKMATPVVDAGEVIKATTAVKTEIAAPDETANQQKASDVSKQYYDKLVKIIADFITKQSGGERGVDEDALRGILVNQASGYEDRGLSIDYLKGLSTTLEKAVIDKKVIAKATSEHMFDVIDSLMRTYAEKFDEQIAAEDARIAREQEEHAQAKVQSTVNLYIAGGCFALFLLIVFLSIFIKIERNLRRG